MYTVQYYILVVVSQLPCFCSLLVQMYSEISSQNSVTIFLFRLVWKDMHPSSRMFKNTSTLFPSGEQDVNGTTVLLSVWSTPTTQNNKLLMLNNINYSPSAIPQRQRRRFIMPWAMVSLADINYTLHSRCLFMLYAITRLLISFLTWI